MGSEFEKWAIEANLGIQRYHLGTYYNHSTAKAYEAYNARQPEIDRLTAREQQLETALREVWEKVSRIAKRPDLPNPDRDADWKNCQKWSQHDALAALATIDAVLGGDK